MNKNKDRTMDEIKTLLIVDDDEIFLNRLGRSLERKGFTPTLANSVAEGKKQAAEISPAYAVVDLRLQDGNGLEVVETIRNVNKDASIVMLTGYGNIASAVAAVKAGAIDYLAKPRNSLDGTKSPENHPDLRRCDSRNVENTRRKH